MFVAPLKFDTLMFLWIGTLYIQKRIYFQLPTYQCILFQTFMTSERLINTKNTRKSAHASEFCHYPNRKEPVSTSFFLFLFGFSFKKKEIENNALNSIDHMSENPS